MVGFFSRLSGGRSGRHRRTQSAVDVSGTPASRVEVEGPALATSASYGAEVNTEFKPVEQPMEPIIHDQAVKCPLPEPSILNDGRIWKERMSAKAGAKTIIPPREPSNVESEASRTRPNSNSFRSAILPSQSAPEHSLTDLLEECNPSFGV